MQAMLIVRIKTGVPDIPSQAKLSEVQAAGYESVTGLVQSKFFQVDLKTDDLEEARRLLRECARRLLANPVIEESSFLLPPVWEKVEPIESSSPDKHKPQG